MAELIVVRHGQASFGADDYDALSDLGHRQSELAGALLRDRGWEPDRLVTGSLRRQKDTMSSMGFDGAEVHDGFNEYDFHDLLHARFSGIVPSDVMQDRKSHFRSLRETVLDWQGGGLPDAGETWVDFTTRVGAALDHAMRPGARRVLVVSSGGAIGQMVANSLGAPAEMMMTLNLQVKNTSLTRFIFNDRVRYLHEFNGTPHLDVPGRTDMLTYS